ncbi:hypothetical protein [Wolbachia endosymbiont (group A) of Ennomos erosarius]|uniref:hypothetical protein n=1 Tax=Wolbachia endosymbiont (group A) of Ennomos erosarius TaxID=3066174 RepID=UPI003341AE1C
MPLNIARDNGHSNIVEYLEKKLKEERTAQRKRRHHHGDHNRHYSHLSHKTLAIDSSDQPEIAASSGASSSSWINGLLCWVKSSIGGLLDFPSQAITTKSPISQIDSPIGCNWYNNVT